MTAQIPSPFSFGHTPVIPGQPFSELMPPESAATEPIGKIHRTLNRLFERAPRVTFRSADRYVVFSDLHMGDGSSSDDFLRNAPLFETVLSRYYLPEGFGAVLNGDIEELQKFSFQKVQKAWKNIYRLFDEVAARNGLHKLVGNHDLHLMGGHLTSPYPVQETLVLERSHLSAPADPIFLLHGHQASDFYTHYNSLVAFSLKYFANPLGIRNYTVSQDSKKQYKIEKRVYKFSNRKKIVSIIGHTHRPLFESLSRTDVLKYRLEHLLRHLRSATSAVRWEMEQQIKSLKSELEQILHTNKEKGLKKNIYGNHIVIPSLFNSGAVIGKGAFTCIELSYDAIQLVQWSQQPNPVKELYPSAEGTYQTFRVGQQEYTRTVLEAESLDYVFDRIRLLT